MSTAQKATLSSPLLKQVRVDVDYTSWPGGNPPPAIRQLVGTKTVDIRDVLREVAIRTAPPMSHGFSLADCWAWQRYAQAFDPCVPIRLRAEWSDLDPHQKTILSDDWGVGMGMHILSSAMGFSRVTTTSYFLSQAPVMAVPKTKNRGKFKSPDFIGFDSSGRIHVIECKGTQLNLKSLCSQMKRGVEQKTNLRFLPGVQVGERLVVGSFIPQFGSSETAQVLVVDPPEDELDPIVDLDFLQISEIITRGELAS